jgi:hypothetical protein
MVDFSKHKKGDVVRVHCCDSYTIHAGYTPKYPADSGIESWPCEVCGQYNIGSMMDCKINDWLILKPFPKHPRGLSG